jgi:hypothetical protein
VTAVRPRLRAARCRRPSVRLWSMLRPCRRAVRGGSPCRPAVDAARRCGQLRAGPGCGRGRAWCPAYAGDAPRQRGDFARPRTRQDCGPRADPAERCPGGPATHGRWLVSGTWPTGPGSGATPGRCRRPALRDNRTRGPAGRAGPRGEHRPWPSSP